MRGDPGLGEVAGVGLVTRLGFALAVGDLDGAYPSVSGA
jgi:hypothetical protein